MLSVKRLSEFSPEEFKNYVRSLYFKKVKTKVKKPLVDFRWSLTKTGKLSIRVNRRPKWLSRNEVDQIGAESGRPAEAWIYVSAKKNKIRIGEPNDDT